MLVFAATQVLPGNAADAILGRTATAEQKASSRSSWGSTAALRAVLVVVSGVLHGDLGTLGREPADRLELHLGAPLEQPDPRRRDAARADPGLGRSSARGPGAPGQGARSRDLGHIARPDRAARVRDRDDPRGVFGVSLAAGAADLDRPIGDSPLSQPTLLVLPVLTLCLVGSAYIVRMVRAGVIESCARTTCWRAAQRHPRAPGDLRHALRNSLAPTVQVVALTVQWLIGGIVVVETVFSYPGLGAGLVGAVTARDIPFVQSVTLILALVYIVINLVADLVVVLLVPKLRTSVADRGRRRPGAAARALAPPCVCAASSGGSRSRVVLAVIAVALFGPYFAPHSPTGLLGVPFGTPAARPARHRLPRRGRAQPGALRRPHRARVRLVATALAYCRRARSGSSPGTARLADSVLMRDGRAAGVPAAALPARPRDRLRQLADGARPRHRGRPGPVVARIVDGHTRDSVAGTSRRRSRAAIAVGDPAPRDPAEHHRAPSSPTPARASRSRSCWSPPSTSSASGCAARRGLGADDLREPRRHHPQPLGGGRAGAADRAAHGRAQPARRRVARTLGTSAEIEAMRR